VWYRRPEVWEWICCIGAFAAMLLIAALPGWWKPLVALSVSCWTGLLAAHILKRLAYRPPSENERGFEVKPNTPAAIGGRDETKKADGHHG
jgi:branched-subunit amino acid ABC-type transport system permease component